MTATSSSVLVTGVTPNHYGTSADAQLTLTGAGFTSSTTVELVAGNGTTYADTARWVSHTTQISAMFSANAVPAGIYSVKVLNADGSSGTLPGAFTMIQGGQANLVTNLILPNPMGRHIASVIYVQYSNTGNIAMPAPLLVLTGTNPLGQQGGGTMTLNAGLAEFRFLDLGRPRGLQHLNRDPGERCHARRTGTR